MATKTANQKINIFSGSKNKPSKNNHSCYDKRKKNRKVIQQKKKKKPNIAKNILKTKKLIEAKENIRRTLISEWMT